jgi:TRAP-type mannitol/chloroaromatic compound transport system substrate-binding protein
MTDKSLSYVNYYATKAEAIACVKTLPFGGVIQLQNGWFHVWQIN